MSCLFILHSENDVCVCVLGGILDPYSESAGTQSVGIRSGGDTGGLVDLLIRSFVRETFLCELFLKISKPEPETSNDNMTQTLKPRQDLVHLSLVTESLSFQCDTERSHGRLPFIKRDSSLLSARREKVLETYGLY